MISQIYWKDIALYEQIPPLAKIATTQTLIKWAAASGDFNPIHFEDTFAGTNGLKKPIIQGQLKRAWLVQFLTDWLGEEGSIIKFSCQFRKLDYPRLMKTISEPQEGETWLCKGKVMNKYMEEERKLIDCDIWIENGKGEITTPGKATVSLP